MYGMMSGSETARRLWMFCTQAGSHVDSERVVVYALTTWIDVGGKEQGIICRDMGSTALTRPRPAKNSH